MSKYTLVYMLNGERNEVHFYKDGEAAFKGLVSQGIREPRRISWLEWRRDAKRIPSARD